MKRILRIGLMTMVLVLMLTAVAFTWTPFNLNTWILPNDFRFWTCLWDLKTPKEICQYMADNFNYQRHKISYSPFEQWLYKNGDCNDYSSYAVFKAHINRYETWQIHIVFTKFLQIPVGHVLGVYYEDGYTYSDCWIYNPIHVDSFISVVHHYLNQRGKSSNYLNYYRVYDYENNVIEANKNPISVVHHYLNQVEENLNHLNYYRVYDYEDNVLETK